MLEKLIYASKASHAMSAAELTGLLTLARQRNQASGISGLLLYCDRSFLQLLEGETEALNALYATIAADTRHSHPRLLLREPIEFRRFPDWTMGFEHLQGEELAEALPGYHPANRFPLISSELMISGRVAENLLLLYRRG